MDTSQIQFSRFPQNPAYNYHSLAAEPSETTSQYPTLPTAPAPVRLTTFGSVPKDTAQTPVDPRTVFSSVGTGSDLVSGMLIGHSLARIMTLPGDRPSSSPKSESMRDGELAPAYSSPISTVSSTGSGGDCCDSSGDCCGSDDCSAYLCCCCCCDKGCDAGGGGGGCDCNCNC